MQDPKAMGEASEELKRRSKAFAAAVLKLIDRFRLL
jgi:hypothetical protein